MSVTTIGIKYHITYTIILTIANETNGVTIVSVSMNVVVVFRLVSLASLVRLAR